MFVLDECDKKTPDVLHQAFLFYS